MSERTDSTDGADDSRGFTGSRVVTVLYAVLVAVAGVAGILIGVFVDGLRAPRFLFLIPFPPTPLGFAAYGALTVAIVLGVPLALVAYVSRYVDEAGP